jgi:hypothetical protein
LYYEFDAQIGLFKQDVLSVGLILLFCHFEFSAQSREFKVVRKGILVWGSYWCVCIMNLLRKVGGLGLLKRVFLFRAHSGAFVL